ncbi:glycosyltransferase family 4 protein [bacterium]|nr:glycosyltransferase family 4 protein [bacterium]
MKIIIDAENTKKQKTGVGYYTYNLIKSLIKVDKENDYELVYWKLRNVQKFNPFGILPDNIKYKKIRFPYSIYFRLFKMGIKIPFSFFSGKADVYLFPNFIVYNLKNKKNIVVIYDVSYLKYPQFSDKKNVEFLTEFVSSTVKNASHVITISENSKKEIMEFYKINQKDISIVSPSYDHNLYYKREASEILTVKDKYSITGQYLLFTSTLEPRKNVENIIKAYLLLPKLIKEQYSLVLAGGKGWQDSKILSDIKKAQDEGEKVIVTGYVLEEDLPVLYSGASLFVYPSIYEGFGIPILEAMACGIPVITSDNSSMPEVAGKAALYVKAEDVNDIKSKIEELLTDNKLQEKLKVENMSQLHKFDWDKSALKLLEVIKKVNE